MLCLLLLVSVMATAQPVFEHLPCTTHPVNSLIFRASQDWPSLSTSSAFNNNGWGGANLLNMKQSEMCVDGAKGREMRGLDWGGPHGCVHGSRMSHSQGKFCRCERRKHNGSEEHARFLLSHESSIATPYASHGSLHLYDDIP